MVKFKKAILSLILLSSTFCVSQEKDIFNDIKCIEELKPNNQSIDSIIIRNCYFLNYKFNEIGVPDYKGRYFWKYKIFEKNKNNYTPINNSSLFNDKVLELEILINKKFKEQYEKDLKISEIEECMSYVKFRYYSLNEMGISINENDEIEFTKQLDIISACINVSLFIYYLKLDDIKKYLKITPTNP